MKYILDSKENDAAGMEIDAAVELNSRSGLYRMTLQSSVPALDIRSGFDCEMSREQLMNLKEIIERSLGLGHLDH